MLQEPLCRGVDSCVNTFSEGQIGAEDKLRQRARCRPLAGLLGHRALVFCGALETGPGLRSEEQPSRVPVTDLLRK